MKLLPNIIIAVAVIVGVAFVSAWATGVLGPVPLHPLLIAVVLTALLFLLRDIVSRRVSQPSLVRELELQKAALDEHAIVAITDPSGVITYVNDKFCKLSQYSSAELIGQTHRIINSGHHPKSFFVDMWRTMARGAVWRGGICNRAKDGTLYWVDTTIVPFTSTGGRISKYIAIRADITDRKIAEERLNQSNKQLSVANEEMEQFVYTVSHDLKSPLITIQGYAGFLKKDVDEKRYDRLEKFAAQITSATDHMRESIDDLLELSRIGRVTHDFETVDIAKLAAEIVTEMDIQINEAGAEVTIEKNIPEVWGDRVRIRQILENLLSNALKYARQDDKQCAIRIGGAVEGGYVRLTIADNGPGVPREYEQKIFELFQRLKTDADGTGIGLVIVKRVAELHRGNAWVEPTPGGGATFCVTFARREEVSGRLAA